MIGRMNSSFAYVNFFQLSERRFRMFLEEVVHPELRIGLEQDHFVTVIKSHLAKDAVFAAGA
jgi:hypothetical protein